MAARAFVHMICIIVLVSAWPCSVCAASVGVRASEKEVFCISLSTFSEIPFENLVWNGLDDTLDAL